MTCPSPISSSFYKRFYFRIKQSLLAITIFGLSGSLLAKDYVVEMILFENLSATQITEPHAYEAPRKPRTGAQAWILDNKLLLEEAELLNQNEAYEVKYHMAWGQESLPFSQSATYTLLEQEAQGYVKIYAENLLFANLDIDFKGLRLKEKRRLKLNEKHYFDHPKFGILLQVSRLEEDTKEAETQD